MGQYEEAVESQTTDRLAQEGLIQRFEYTFELGWKTLQDLLKERGLEEVRGPKPVIQQAFKDGLVGDGSIWLEMLRARNQAEFLYDESIFKELYQKSTGLFFKALCDFKTGLKRCHD
ncbi:MAG: nucleotidyltransferase substrate binding protein [Deltaproteobacteria bacterium]|nr:nucleotidyltransferase substrate binding protein [Deltaproteobacteria bacterium]